jgi:RimJ/RimL family protein N-acetyltransferase
MAVPPTRLATKRLTLRPSSVQDADWAFATQSDWEVTRMLRRAAFPPVRTEIAAWFSGHPQEWQDGRAFRFAVMQADQVLGLVDIDEIADGSGELGYWFARTAWGNGYAAEAAAAVCRFGFETIGLEQLRSGHADDNPASGAVLRKLGFVATGRTTLPSRSRGSLINQLTYRLRRDDFRATPAARAG